MRVKISFGEAAWTRGGRNERGGSEGFKWNGQKQGQHCCGCGTGGCNCFKTDDTFSLTRQERESGSRGKRGYEVGDRQSWPDIIMC